MNNPISHRLVPVVEDLLKVADLEFLEVDVLQVDLFVVPQLAHLFIFLLKLLANLKIAETMLTVNGLQIDAELTPMYVLSQFLVRSNEKISQSDLYQHY